MSGIDDPSTERPMPLAVVGDDDRAMDEATVDCQWCGLAGACEIRIEDLDDRANWRALSRVVACIEHREAYLLGAILWLRDPHRLVVMPLV